MHRRYNRELHTAGGGVEQPGTGTTKGSIEVASGQLDDRVTAALYRRRFDLDALGSEVAALDTDIQRRINHHGHIAQADDFEFGRNGSSRLSRSSLGGHRVGQRLGRRRFDGWRLRGLCSRSSRTAAAGEHQTQHEERNQTLHACHTFVQYMP